MKGKIEELEILKFIKVVICIYYPIMRTFENIQMKKFILTGEPSGDKLASKVIKELKKDSEEIEYLSVGGEHLQP